MLVLLFAAASFLGASLLFLVQPMVAKMLLPLLGGSASVWTTCMLFFQAGLLGGYLYAHLLTSRLGARLQVATHAAVLGVALLALPISLDRLTPPAGTQAPLPWLLASLAIVAGAPFFALASTGPLLQRWLHGTDHPSARDPYHLYAAGNLGSFAGLILYPVLLEPLLPLATPGARMLPPRLVPWSQSGLWAAGYLVFAGCVLAAGALALRRPGPALPEAAGGAPTTRERLTWMLLAFVPSSAVLGVTQYVTAEIAAVPLLWVIPLALYLLTFVVAFSPRVTLPPLWMGRAVAVAVLATAASMTLAVRSRGQLLVAIHLAGLVVIGLALHGRLAASRPRASRLTEFYLWIAAGGALGGVFNAIVAPLAFKTVAEYPVALFLAVLLRPRPAERVASPRPWARALDVGIGLAVGTLPLSLGRFAPDVAGPVSWPLVALLAGVPALLCLALIAWPLRFTLAVGALLIAGWWQISAPRASLDRERTFFGVHRVVPTLGPWFRETQAGAMGPPKRREFVSLLHGGTCHGMQAVAPAFRKIPTTYYHRDGPLGRAWTALDLDARATDIGLVGLGAGTIAAYGRAGQRMTYFELDPAVARIARDRRYFTFIADSPATVAVEIGDGRLRLARVADQAFDVLVLDAFSSDSIPVHLLTEEAIALDLRKLRPEGVLFVHLTNHYLGLEDVVSAIAGRLGVPGAITWDSDVSPRAEVEGKYGSVWAVLSPSRTRLAPVHADARWYPLPLPARPGAPDPARVLWTDARSDLLSVLKHF